MKTQVVITAMDMVEFTKNAVAFLSKVSADAQVLILHGIQERLKEPTMFFPLMLAEKMAEGEAAAPVKVKVAKDAKPRSGDPEKRSKAMKLAWKKRKAAAAAALKEKEQAKSKPKKKAAKKSKDVRSKDAPAQVFAKKGTKLTKKKVAKTRTKTKKSKPAPATEAVPTPDDAASAPDNSAAAANPELANAL